MWLKNTKGKPDGMLTLSVLAFVLGAFCLLYPMLFQNKEPSEAIALSLIAATLGSYVARKKTENDYLLELERLKNQHNPESKKE